MVGALHTTKLRVGLWRLDAPLTYRHPRLPQGELTVPRGFTTDFASVPRWLPLVYAVLGDTAHEAAVIHDYLYRTGIVSRRAADIILRDVALDTGEPPWRAWALYWGVRVGAWPVWRRYRRGGGQSRRA